MRMLVLAEDMKVKDTQRLSQHNNMLSDSYGMFSTWVPLVQIKTASIGDDSGGSRLNHYP
eukprot:scaffold4822_cov67-Attheya_sp.AAC.2